MVQVDGAADEAEVILPDEMATRTCVVVLEDCDGQEVDIFHGDDGMP